MESNNPQKVSGLCMFLYDILDLIKCNEHETIEDIENAIGKSITEYISAKYFAANNKACRFSNNKDEIDEYYKNYYGANLNYGCEKDDGLYILIKFVLNKLH